MNAPKWRLLPSLFLLVILASACGSPKKAIYFRTDAPLDTNSLRLPIPSIPETIIRPDDILAIHVSTTSSITEGIDPASIYNEGGTAFPVTATGGQTGGLSSNKGYLVDKEGYIDFPAVGKLSVAGMNIRAVKELLKSKIQNSIKDPVVEVRILNYKVIMLGEIGMPGVVLAPNHGLNIIEAIAAAGDIRLTGNRENVLLIRQQEDGGKIMVRLNLHSREIFNSPYYYLQQNDIVYVEPNRLQRQQNNEFLRFYLPTITSLISTALAVYGITQIANSK